MDVVRTGEGQEEAQRSKEGASKEHGGAEAATEDDGKPATSSSHAAEVSLMGTQTPEPAADDVKDHMSLCIRTLAMKWKRKMEMEVAVASEAME